jgi:hypothetical protein
MERPSTNFTISVLEKEIKRLRIELANMRALERISNNDVNEMQKRVNKKIQELQNAVSFLKEYR